MKILCCSIMALCFLTQSIEASSEEIKGDDIVEIAVQGESQAVYTAPEKYLFYLNQTIKGVQLSQDGVLTITNQAKEKDIMLYAKKDQRIVKKKVRLVTSWTLNVKGAQAYRIPNPKQTRRIETSETLDKILPPITVQMTVIIGSIVVGIGYVIIRRK